ncbi:MAG: hypothetical protein A2087_03645 [Spirochaetes bacterium GWD1_61_31]|nr:MAG: hypothetical protein A2Y37_01020 [Spirochaetes bacterium GWB1_60_80]OHD30983.1 MAG: hypothetical protein A2004_06810 [Spirochaetes bacterium GWC1_61_12]OHD36185.1 MAG: hypothetical protein A2087_03645 [Spirochaetes bacterium GWD1_61_31]OHD43249.1 MAG: hypothetical protein A2Y35_08465 [Spirochaetes bacterium GWE1_60_18]OHD58809.1 MAG: hypothetical protein A2Y32_01300 [Spirochaetes bacterium GWF1_60_12]HAP43331.1 hypothetical protein [Spirochaetaceae bacterium]
MYAFLLVSAPVSLMALSAWFYTREERLHSPVHIFRGLVSALPMVFLWYLAGGIIPPNWGSGSLVFLYWWQFWLLPVLLTVPGWLIANGRAAGTELKATSLLSFLLPYLGVFCLGWMVFYWSMPFAAPVLVLPLLTVSSLILLAGCVELARWYGLPSGLVWALPYLAASLLGAWAYALLFWNRPAVGLLLAGFVAGGSTVGGIIILRRKYIA